jgi:hypothetical protein
MDRLYLFKYRPFFVERYHSLDRKFMAIYIPSKYRDFIYISKGSIKIIGKRGTPWEKLRKSQFMEKGGLASPPPLQI